MSHLGHIRTLEVTQHCIHRTSLEIGIPDLNPDSSASSELWGGMNIAKMPYSSPDPFDSWISRPGIMENVW